MTKRREWMRWKRRWNREKWSMAFCVSLGLACSRVVSRRRRRRRRRHELRRTRTRAFHVQGLPYNLCCMTSQPAGSPPRRRRRDRPPQNPVVDAPCNFDSKSFPARRSPPAAVITLLLGRGGSRQIWRSTKSWEQPTPPLPFPRLVQPQYITVLRSAANGGGVQ